MLRSFNEKISRLFITLEGQCQASRMLNGIVLIVILLNVIAVVLESVKPIYQQFSEQFGLFQELSITLFSIEYLLRLRTGSNKIFNINHQTIKQSLRHVLSPLMLIDLFSLLPFYLGISLLFDCRLLRLFRLLSILQISRHSRALQIVFSVIERERQTFAATFLLISVLIVFISAIIFTIEHKVQPEVFASIPDAMWWTMATITTVGYGDAVPMTLGGKVFGMIVMFIGIAMFAVPTGILVSAFYQEIKRKDFIATWDLVAQVPFFSQLHALDIARITDLLSLHAVRADEVVFHQGDKADSMYFIVSGEVEINKNGNIILARGGDFFGEVGVLYNMPRKATVTTRTYVELLRLDIKDIELFLELHPQLRQHILAEAEARNVEAN